MARIYLDARAAASATSGLGRYCHSLIPELTAQAPQHEFTIIGPPGLGAVAMASNACQVDIGGVGGTVPLLMSATKLRRLFRQRGPADVYHALFHVVPFGIRRGTTNPRRVIVTLLDLIWIDFAPQIERTAIAAAWRRRLALTAIPYALQTADHVICISEATAQRAQDWLPRERRTVVHLGVGDEFFTHEDDPNAIVPRAPVAYIAAFGVDKAYKNVACLVRAFGQVRRDWPQLRLVLIGGDGGASRDIEQAGIAPAVDIVRGATDREMRALMRGARVFVVPSMVEGFGLPVVEAMALGTPVVTSAAAALLEVAGDAALRFDAENPSSLAVVLSRLLADPLLQSEMATLGRARAALFRWSRAARQTLDIYDRVLASNGTAATEARD